MIATKNQKQTISLTIVSSEGGIYNKVLFKICQKGCTGICCIFVYENESNVKRDVIYVLYILIVMYLDP